MKLAVWTNTDSCDLREEGISLELLSLFGVIIYLSLFLFSLCYFGVRSLAISDFSEKGP